MAKHTLKILRCEHRKILKYIWPFYNIMHKRVNSPYLSQNNFLRKTYYFLLDTHNLKDIKIQRLFHNALLELQKYYIRFLSTNGIKNFAIIATFLAFPYNTNVYCYSM